PFRSAWEACLDKLFRYLDTNGDGFLSNEEMAGAPPVQALFNTSGRVWGPVAMPRARDGKVTRAELAEYYRRQGAEPFQFYFSGNNTPRDGWTRVFAASGEILSGESPSADVLNDRLFELLDRNRDGKLSREELAAAPAILARLDADDDEMLTPAELMGN